MGTYLVRAMSQAEEDFKVFFQNSEKDVIAVGWSCVAFSAFKDIDQLIEEVKRTYYSDNNTAPQVIGKKINEVKRFKGMRAGDQVIVPYGNQIRLGIVQHGEVYDETLRDHGDLSNQRHVKYFQENGKYVSIPRTALSEGLQRRLRVRGTTVADLSEFEDEINHFFKDPQSSWDSRFNEAELRQSILWQQKLLKNITGGKTNLKAGGMGLEQLVQYLLELDGYKAEILSKRKFSGLADADIRATKSDQFSGTSLFVQVKHHSGTSDAWGAEQLAKIRELQENDSEILDYKMILVTSAEASEKLRVYAESQDIQLFVGSDLAKWIYDLLEKIDIKRRTILGISRTGEIIS